MTTATARSIRLPADRFYWCIIDAHDLPRRGLLHRITPEQVRYAFEPFLPLPVDDVEIITIALIEGRLLGCAIDRPACEAALHDGAISFGPDSIPGDLHLTNSPPAESFNFLRGPLEALPLTRLHRRWSCVGVAMLFIVVVLLNIGISRRRAAVSREMEQIAARISTLYQDAVGHLTVPGGQPPAIILTGELRRLRQTRSAVEDPTGPDDDAGRALNRLLIHWPDDVHALTESIIAAPPLLTIACSLPDSVEAQRMTAALSTVDGWQAQQPQVRGQGGRTRLVVSLECLQNPTTGTGASP